MTTRLVSVNSSRGYRVSTTSVLARIFPNKVLYFVFSFILSHLQLNVRYIGLESQSGWGALDLVCCADDAYWPAILILWSPSLWTRLIIDRGHFELDCLRFYLHLSYDRPLGHTKQRSAAGT